VNVVQQCLVAVALSSSLRSSEQVLPVSVGRECVTVQRGSKGLREPEMTRCNFGVIAGESYSVALAPPLPLTDDPCDLCESGERELVPVH
jgi:hypothetical protein